MHGFCWQEPSFITRGRALGILDLETFLGNEPDVQRGGHELVSLRKISFFQTALNRTVKRSWWTWSLHVKQDNGERNKEGGCDLCAFVHLSALAWRLMHVQGNCHKNLSGVRSLTNKSILLTCSLLQRLSSFQQNGWMSSTLMPMKAATPCMPSPISFKILDPWPISAAVSSFQASWTQI